MPILFSSYTYFTQDQPPERLCIFCGNRVGVVVEVRIDGVRAPPLGDPPRPGIELGIGIVAPPSA